MSALIFQCATSPVAAFVLASRVTFRKATTTTSGRISNVSKNQMKIQILQSREHVCTLPRRYFSSLQSASTFTIETTVVNGARAISSSSELGPVDLKFMDFCREKSFTVATKPAPVLLLHGLLGNKRNFATIGTSLSSQLETKRRIVGVDLRNHGDNTHDWRDSMTYPELASDIIRLLDSQGMETAILVGHSMGGKVAMATALLYPERIEGLVVLDVAPVVYDAEKDSNWKAVAEILQVLDNVVPVGQPGITKRDVDKLLAQEQGGILSDPALRAFCLTNLEFVKDDDGNNIAQWKIPLHVLVSELDEMAKFDIQDRSSSSLHDHVYEGDTFFIHGGQSRFVRSSHMETIKKYFPNHLLTTIRGAGHWVHAEAPDDTSALLKRYLDRA